MAFNYSIVPACPAVVVWTSTDDLTCHVQLELALGKLPFSFFLRIRYWYGFTH
jgi:hypothetical protein